MRKRKYRRNRSVYRKRKTNMKTASFLMIICCSVLAGYVTATYIIGPALGLESQPASFDFIKEDQNKEKNIDNNENDSNKNMTVLEDQIDMDKGSGFALQYGSFSAIEGAQQCVDDLKAKGIEASVIEKDGSFKVIGKLFSTKEEAREYKENSPDSEDAFITEIP